MALPGGSPLDHDITDNLPARAKRLLRLPVQFGTHATGIPKSNGELILRLPLGLLTGAQQCFLGTASVDLDNHPTQLRRIEIKHEGPIRPDWTIDRQASQRAIGAHRRGWWRSNGFHLHRRSGHSASVKELDALRREMEKARKLIATLRESELDLKNRNDALSTAHHQLHSEFTELRGKHSQLHAAHGALGELVASLRKDLERERKLRDTQYAELMREKAKHGEL